MFGFGKQRPFDRQESLRAAEAWRAKGKPKKAIAELRRILAVDPGDATAHARLGPLLVLTGEAKAALPSLLASAEDLVERGFEDRAVSLYLQVADIESTNVSAWETAAKLHVGRGRVAEGAKVLTTGAGRQRGRDGRQRAIQLYQAALALTPTDVELLLTLARLLRKTGAAAEARALLERAAEHATSWAARKRVRWTWFVLFPGLGTLWRWLRRG